MSDFDLDVMIQEFEMMFPTLAEEAVNYYIFDEMELAAVLSDGTTRIYDYLLKTVGFLKEKKDYAELSKDEWIDGFSKKLYREMKLRGFNQLKLAEVTGLSQVSVSKYMNGDSVPNVYNIDKISKALGCQISDLTNF